MAKKTINFQKDVMEPIGQLKEDMINLDKYVGMIERNPVTTVTGYKLTSSGRVVDVRYKLVIYEVVPFEKIGINVTSDSEITYQFRSSENTSVDTNIISSYTGNKVDIVDVPESANRLVFSVLRDAIRKNCFVYCTDVEKNKENIDALNNVADSIVDRELELHEVIKGKYVNKSKGNILDNSQTDVYAYIPVKEGMLIYAKNIYTEGNCSICGYNESKKYIKCYANKVGTHYRFTIDGDVKYISVTVLDSVQPKLEVIKGFEIKERNIKKIDDSINYYRKEFIINRFINGYLNISGNKVIDHDSYCCTDFIEVEELNEITIKNICCTAGKVIHCYDASKNNIYSESGTNGVVSSIDFTLPKGTKYIRFSLQKIQKETMSLVYKNLIKYNSLWNNLIKGWYESSNMNISTLFKRCASRPIATFIDDDTLTVEATKAFYDNCVAKNIKGTYAVYTDKLDANQELVNQLKTYEKNGFHMALHTSTHGQYFRQKNEGDELLIEEDMVCGMRKMKEFGFVDYMFWVTPFGVHSDFIQSIGRKYGFKCAVSCANNEYETYARYGRYYLQRPEILNDSTMTITDMKALIDDCCANNGWIILASHFGYVDYDVDRWNEIAQYVIDKGIITMPLNEAFRNREKIYDLKDMF